MTNSCATCRFWATEDNRQGLCRRYPPTPMMIGLGQPSIVADPARSQAQPIIMSYFPNMLEHGWCGEFSPRLAS